MVFADEARRASTASGSKLVAKVLWKVVRELERREQMLLARMHACQVNTPERTEYSLRAGEVQIIADDLRREINELQPGGG